MTPGYGSQQSDKPGLLEMHVSGQRRRHTRLSHHDKGQAVCQTPRLVRPAGEQGQRVLETQVGDWNDLEEWLLSKRGDELHGSFADRRFGKGCPQFQEHRLGGNQSGPRLCQRSGQGCRWGMVLILAR